MTSDAVKPRSVTRTWGHGVGPGEWRRRLLTLMPPARWAAARIVWWDFFGDQMYSERWKHLDDMIKHRTEVDAVTLANALVAIGYTEQRAAARVMPPKPRKPRKRK